MLVLLLLVLIFVPAVCFSQTLDIEKFEVRQEKAFIPLLIGIALVSLAVGIYTFLQMRKMQKKNQQKDTPSSAIVPSIWLGFGWFFFCILRICRNV